MSESEDRLARRVRDAWPAPDGGVPPFAKSWRGASLRRAAAVRRYRGFAAAAVVTAALIIVVALRTSPTGDRIEMADLLNSTSWSAPSDALLPDRQFDIYQELPDLPESSDPAGGTLL